MYSNTSRAKVIECKTRQNEVQKVQWVNFYTKFFFFGRKQFRFELCLDMATVNIIQYVVVRFCSFAFFSCLLLSWGFAFIANLTFKSVIFFICGKTACLCKITRTQQLRFWVLTALCLWYLWHQQLLNETMSRDFAPFFPWTGLGLRVK